MTPSINFTVPLTARVLRAILADMEGTAGCGCHAPVALPHTFTAEEIKSFTAPATQGQHISHQEAEQDEHVGETVNPFHVTYPMPSVATGTLLVDGVPAPPIYAEPVPVLPIYPNPAATSIETLVQPMPPVTPPPLPNLMPAVSYADTVFVEPPAPPVPPVGVQTAQVVQVPPATVQPPPTLVSAPAPPCPPIAGVKVDGEGLPWDKRIHASTKTFRQSDNTWKLLKGIDPALVTSVKAELRACIAAPAPTTPYPAPNAADLNIQPPSEAFKASIVASYAPPAPPADPRFAELQERDNAVTALITASAVPLPPVVQEAVTLPTVPVPATGITFEQFCAWFTGKMAAKELSRPQLEKACADNGITSLPMLQNRPDLVPVIHRFLESICFPASSIGGE